VCSSDLMVLLLIQRFLSIWILIPVTLATAIVAVVLYLIRFQSSLIAKAYSSKSFHYPIDLICSFTGYPPPVDSTCLDELPKQILLRRPDDFAWARRKAKQEVIGHNELISEILTCLDQRITLLDQSRVARGQTPLACHLLAGPDGIGKRHLAQVLASLLFAEGILTTIDLANYADPHSGSSALLGSTNQKGHMTEAVKRHPYQVLLLENMAHLPTDLQHQLRAIAKTGAYVDPCSGGVVSLEHVYLVLSATSEVPPSLTQDVRSKSDCSPSQWDDLKQRVLAEELGLDPLLLSQMHYVGIVERPNVFDMASIVAHLMHRECDQYGVSIEFVDPAVIAAEVERFNSHHGFQFTQARLSRKLRCFILQAQKSHSRRLVVTSNDW